MQHHRSLLAVLSTLLVLALPLVPHAYAATDAANASVLKSNLPAGVTLVRATIPQTVSALHEAVLQHQEDALDLFRIAVLAKTPKQNDGKLPCPDLRRLVQAACTAAPDKTSQIVELAITLDPDCADGLQDLLAGDANGLDSGASSGFSVGFGPGFPGAPGFVGSAPSGGFALPPASPTPVTPAAND